LGAGIIVMHKIFSRANLLAATALTSVALFGGQQVLAQGKAAKIKLGLSGGMTSLLGFGTQKSSFEKSSNADVSGVTHYEQFNIIMDTEIHVSGSIRLDNGMTVSVVAEFEADQFTANGASGQGDKGIDDSYMSLDGGFGQIRIGSTSPGSHDFANTAPVIGALSHDNGDTDNWVVVPAASGLGSPGSDISDGNVMKIVYVTPSMAGFILGGSYEPGAATSELVAASGGNSGTETQSFDVGLGYAAKLGKANISADIQYQRRYPISAGGGPCRVVDQSAPRGHEYQRRGVHHRRRLPAGPGYGFRCIGHRKLERSGHLGHRCHLFRFRLGYRSDRIGLGNALDQRRSRR